MTSLQRLVGLTAVTLALGFAAGCEQQNATESGAANDRADRTGQSSERAPGAPGNAGSAQPGSNPGSNSSSDR